MKKTLHLSLMFLFFLSLGACTSGKQSAIEVKDPTSKTRFVVSSDGVISDAGTGLEWVTGPSFSSYSLARNWLTSCGVAGGGWRMPTVQELKTLCQPSGGQNNMPAPAFENFGWLWAESADISQPTLFDISADFERTIPRQHEPYATVVGVRSRPR